MTLATLTNSKVRLILLFCSILALLVFALKWHQWQFLFKNNSLVLYTRLIALFFTCLGVWAATPLIWAKVRTGVLKKEVYGRRRLRTPSTKASLGS